MLVIDYVEDDPDMAQSVAAFLGMRGYAVRCRADASAFRLAFEAGPPALALIDIALPDEDGLSLCAWARARDPRLPIVCLTARDDPAQIVSGFASGADDYVTKPFDPEVLLARISALLRRAGPPSCGLLTCGDIALDEAAMTVTRGGEAIPLTRAEYDLLLLLMRNKGCILTRSRLLEQLWDSGGRFVSDNALTVAMRRMREKLGYPSCLKTVRSFGYRMEE